MSATSDLRSEHIGVARMLTIMRHMVTHMEIGRAPDVPALDESIEFLRVFVDKCHHGKEEQLLFPAMRSAEIREVDDTIDMLLAEHVRGREIVARIVAATDAARAGDAAATRDLIRALCEYSELLEGHIRREEGDCFPVADTKLADVVQAQLQEGYDRIEREVVGEGRHEAFHEMLDRLAAEYR